MKTIAAIILIFASILGGLFAEELFYIEMGDTIFLSPENKSPQTRALAPQNPDDWLVTSTGHRIKLAGGAVVQIKSIAAPEKTFNLPTVKTYEQLTNNFYLVMPTDESKALELSRELLKNPLVIHSIPNMVREKSLR
jgi:hypothetical protein